jgi:hypothetical protein
MKGKKDKGLSVKKPIFKKWWFWVIIVVILAAIIGSGGENENEALSTTDDPSTSTSTPQTSDTQTDDTQGESNSEFDNINFVVRNVRNDVTGNWRITTIAESIETQNYALDYYNKYFEGDEEIHAIVNFTYNTTSKISVMGNLLDVTIYEYVDKEEHDAKLLFSGMVLDEYFIDIDSGEILNAQETTSTKEVSPDSFVADVKDVIQGAISSKDESITDVVLQNSDLCVYVDFSEKDPAPLTLEDLALARTSSITDAILELKDYDSLWETITVDFGATGHITNSKENMETNGTGRYFSADDFKLE